jgi:hypothetical protein
MTCPQCPADDAVECMCHSDNGYDEHGRCSCSCHPKVYHTFVLHPGNVKSKHDGQWHWISATQLMGLYKVPRDAETIVVDWGHPDRVHRAMIGRQEDEERYIHLYPNHDGNYRPVTGLLYRKTTG